MIRKYNKKVIIKSKVKPASKTEENASNVYMSHVYHKRFHFKQLHNYRFEYLLFTAPSYKNRDLIFSSTKETKRY